MMREWWMMLACAAVAAGGGDGGGRSDETRAQDMNSRKDHDTAMSTEAEFRWAQRKDRILITIDLQV